MSKSKERPYVICCEPRVVLFGYATQEEIEKDQPTLKRARMLVYWDRATKGVHGSASVGPQPGCRVTPAVPEQTINTKIEARLRCTDAAAKLWESGPWG